MSSRTTVHGVARIGLAAVAACVAACSGPTAPAAAPAEHPGSAARAQADQAASRLPAPRRYVVQPEQSSVRIVAFSIVGAHPIRVDRFSGWAEVVKGNLERSKVYFEIDMDSVSAETLHTVFYTPNSGGTEGYPTLCRYWRDSVDSLDRIYVYPDDWPPPLSRFPMAPQSPRSDRDMCTA